MNKRTVFLCSRIHQNNEYVPKNERVISQILAGSKWTEKVQILLNTIDRNNIFNQTEFLTLITNILDNYEPELLCGNYTQQLFIVLYKYVYSYGMNDMIANVLINNIESYFAEYYYYVLKIFSLDLDYLYENRNHLK